MCIRDRILHPSMLVAAILPVIVGLVLSSMLIVWVAVVKLPHASVTRYVLVITIGHVPVLLSLLVTTSVASGVQASLIVKPIPSNAATVAAGAGAALILQPSMLVAAILPVIVGLVLSSMLIVWVAVVKLPHASVTRYVLVITIGHVPVLLSLLVTASVASGVQASLIVKPIPSNAATVTAGAGAALILHPSMLVAAILPVIVGLVLSSMLIVWVAVVKLPHASVTRYVLVITIGHVPVLLALLVTTSVASGVQASLIVKPIPSNAATVAAGAGAALILHPSMLVAAILPVIVGLVLSSMLIVWVAVVKLPHASVTRYVLVITIGHVPVLLSLLVTASV